MKKTTLLLLVFLGIACKQTPSENNVVQEDAIGRNQNKEAFDWLVGNWKRTNEEAGKSTYEFWNKASDSEYKGIGFTLKEEDTLWQEHMQLENKMGRWELLIKSPEDLEPVVFEISELAEGSFTAENFEIEFPNKIEYWRTENGFRARVSGSEMELPFDFVRQE